MSKKPTRSIELHLGAKPTTFEHAQALRKNETKAEDILWEYLRARRMLGLKFRRQHPINQFIADFYCHELKLIIEVDGEVHEKNDQKAYDSARSAYLKKLGIHILRLKNKEILADLKKTLHELEKSLQTLI